MMVFLISERRTIIPGFTPLPFMIRDRAKYRSGGIAILVKKVVFDKFFFFFFLIQFYIPFKLFHSYRDESIGRWGENRSTRGKTT